MNAETCIERIKSGLYYWRSGLMERRRPMSFHGDAVVESGDAAPRILARFDLRTSVEGLQ